MRLSSAFNELETPISKTDELIFSARPIPAYPSHRVAKNPFGRPGILIATAENDHTATLTAPIMLEKLQVLPDMECRIELPSGLTEVGVFTVVVCTSPDEPLQKYFLHVMESIVAILGLSPTRKDVADSIVSLVELFRSLSTPARKSIRGLWAELLMMELAADPECVVGCWHQTPLDHYDFSDGLQRIEVKSSASRARQHHFSYEQLNPPPDTVVLVASTYVETDAGGLSVLDLVQRIRQHISDPNLVFHLESTVGLTVGRDSGNLSEHRFDYQLAKDSLRVFRSTDIPAVRGEIPSNVREIRFLSDLSQTPVVDVEGYGRRGGLFQALWGK